MANSIELTAVITGNADPKTGAWSKKNDSVTLEPNGLKCKVTAAKAGADTVTFTPTDTKAPPAVCEVTVNPKPVPPETDLDKQNVVLEMP